MASLDESQFALKQGSQADAPIQPSSKEPSGSPSPSTQRAQATVLKRLEDEGLAVTNEIRALSLQALKDNDGHVGRALNRLKLQIQKLEATRSAHATVVKRL